jgi:hypothetical protein
VSILLGGPEGLCAKTFQVQNASSSYGTPQQDVKGKLAVFGRFPQFSALGWLEGP